MATYQAKYNGNSVSFTEIKNQENTNKIKEENKTKSKIGNSRIKKYISVKKSKSIKVIKPIHYKDPTIKWEF